jgi:hypothetical protein
VALGSEGKRFGEYRILGEIARGGQGAVLRAEREADGRPIAIKMLLSRLPKQVARFRQEAQVLEKLSHPNLIHVFGHGEQNGLPYLAMELVEGQDLADLAGEAGLEPERAAALLAPIAEALQHCHDRGVIHRDLKPANVIVEAATGRPVLVDFGLVKRDPDKLSVDSLGVSRLSLTGELRGTPAFMAPEQVNPSKFGAVSPRTDVYALGATLFALLTGEPPFEADHFPGLLAAIIAQPPPDPRQRRPEVPASLAQLCQRCLSKDPEARPASAQAVADALAGSGSGEAGARRPAAGAALIALVLAGLALGGVGWAATRGEEVVQPAPARAAAEPAEPEAPPPPPLSAEELEAGERDLRRLQHEEEPRKIAEAASRWLSDHPRHPRAEEVAELRRTAELSFPVRTYPGLRAQFLDDERVVAYELGGGARHVVVRSLEGQELKRWPVPWPASEIVLSPDRKRLAIGGWEAEVLVIDLSRDEVAWRLPYDRWVSDLAFSPDGARLAVGGCRVRRNERGELDKWDFDARVLTVEGGEVSAVLEDVRAEVHGFAFVDEGLLVARGANVMDTQTNLNQRAQLGNAVALHDLASGALTREETLTTRPNFLLPLPGGDLIAGTNGGRILRCDASGRVISQYTAEDSSFNRTGPRFLISAQGSALRAGALLPGGERFCVVGGELVPVSHGELSVWNAGSKARVHRVSLPASNARVDASPDGAWLLLSNREGSTLWHAP